MDTVSTVNDAVFYVKKAKKNSLTVAFVPTMGNLHDGHLALVRQAKKVAQYIVVSIYVNPLQFDKNSDFDIYPRTFEEDQKKLAQEGAHLLFAPSSHHELYPDGALDSASVKIHDLENIHCAKIKPYFFSAAATIVMKLFNIIAPDIALFGEKDFQQLCVIKKMVQRFFLPIKVIGVPTVREHNGLAMSSRNHYLTKDEKEKASHIYRTLQKTAKMIQQGEKNYHALSQKMFLSLQNLGFRPEYYNIVAQSTLQRPHAEETHLIILTACYLGKTRLIDNDKVTITTKPSS